MDEVEGGSPASGAAGATTCYTLARHPDAPARAEDRAESCLRRHPVPIAWPAPVGASKFSFFELLIIIL